MIYESGVMIAFITIWETYRAPDLLECVGLLRAMMNQIRVRVGEEIGPSYRNRKSQYLTVGFDFANGKTPRRCYCHRACARRTTGMAQLLGDYAIPYSYPPPTLWVQRTTKSEGKSGWLGRWFQNRRRYRTKGMGWGWLLSSRNEWNLYPSRLCRCHQR